jgi:UDP-perosamine 4-acetyltransferase
MHHRLVIYGAGGHAKVVLEALRAAGLGDRLVGLVDDAPAAASLLGAPILGRPDLLPALRGQGILDVVVAVGDNARRAAIGAALQAQGFGLPLLRHPSAILSPSACLGAGAQVLARVVVGPEAEVGPLAILNTGAIVEHDCVVGAAAHVAPGAVMCGGARLGAQALLGAGAVLRPGTIVGAAALIGAGSAVTEAVPDGAIMGGVPARTISSG